MSGTFCSKKLPVPFFAAATFLLLLLQWTTTTTDAFSLLQQQQQHAVPGRRRRSFSLPIPLSQPQRRPTLLFMTTTTTINDQDSNDPYVVLGLLKRNSGSLDKRSIKRAYKRMALKFHPDVVVTKDSTGQAKREASDRFAKINWAYQTVLKELEGGGGSSSSSSSQSTTSSSGGGWTPPHRRQGTYGTSSSSSSSSSQRKTATTTTDGGGYSTDWRDYMPNYYNDDDDDGDGGDSFSAIFSDLLMDAASGGTRIVNDFVDFLEQNVDGYTSSSSWSSSREAAAADDQLLRQLLQTGSVEQVGDEMEDTELIVEQLQVKLRNLQEEMLQMNAADSSGNAAVGYRATMELQERQAEVQAQTKVVQRYLQQAQQRLVKLQTRYKELIMTTTRRGSSSSSSPRRESTQTASPAGAAGASSSSSSSGRRPSSNDDDDWKKETFGSFGRRGSNSNSSRRRRQAQQRQSTTTAASTSSSRSSSSSSSSGEETRTPQNWRNTNYDPTVPPHRRRVTSSPYDIDDKRRLRELKVDEEIDKLKKELGLL